MHETTPLVTPYQNQLSDAHIRNGFIQKVYGILCVQLLVTTAVASWVMSMGFKTNPGGMMFLVLLSLVFSTGIMCYFSCNPEEMRKTPKNYILLGLFTLAEGVIVGFISAQYTQESVLMVLAITVVVVFSLTLFACQTSIDFTGMGAYLYAAVMCLMGLGLVLWLASMMGASGPAFQGMHLFYAAAGALIFSMFLVYDTQLIVGGKHQHSYEIDDYCMAAISLYTDIIQLFLFMLQLFGDRD